MYLSLSWLQCQQRQPCTPQLPQALFQQQPISYIFIPRLNGTVPADADYVLYCPHAVGPHAGSQAVGHLKCTADLQVTKGGWAHCLGLSRAVWGCPTVN